MGLYIEWNRKTRKNIVSKLEHHLKETLHTFENFVHTCDSKISFKSVISNILGILTAQEIISSNIDISVN